MLTTKRISTLLILLMFASTSNFVHASAITWATPVNITADTDVATNGTLLYAYAWSGNTQAVNGVTFTGSTNNQLGGTDITLTNFGNNIAGAFTSSSDPFNSLSAAYKAILVGGDFNIFGDNATVTIQNLTVGHDYLVQVWINDPRPAPGRFGTVTDANTVSITYSVNNVAGSPGQYTIGTFNAANTSQGFVISSNGSSQINAIQVRDVSTAFPPTATPQTVNVIYNTAAAVTLSGTEMSTPPKLPLTYMVTTNPQHGTLTGTAPNLTYTPTAGYNGADSFKFTTTNTANLTSQPATVTLNVAPAIAPTANNQSVDVPFNTAVAVTLTGSDSNVPALTPLIFTVTVSPQHGTLTGTAPHLTYTPASKYSGPDSFKFTTTNTANVTSSAATISLTVASIGAPTANPQSVQTEFNTSVAITLTATDPNTPAQTPLVYAVIANPQNGTLTGTAPNLAYTPAVGFLGADSFQFAVTNAAGLTSDSATVSIAVINQAPTITSGATATPNPAVINTLVSFNVAAGDAENDPLNYTWDFGDGSTANGAAPTHTYAVAGTYVIIASVGDNINPAVTSALILKVFATSPVVGEGADSDGDGFSDSLEMALGTDPLDAANTPTGNSISETGLQSLTLSKVLIKLNFARNNRDAISIRGKVAIQTGFIPAGQKFSVDAGGVVKAFTLSSTGRGVSGSDSVSITLKKKMGVVQAQAANFSISLAKGSFASTLSADGLTNATVQSAAVKVPFVLIFNGTVSQQNQSMNYKAKAGKSGEAK